ncbi:hypothetical protein J4405_02795 [Candidatus Woesearchaeota archaeon]|nr:hypothetical protein [Candidatus Woesearchaeota archaeon]
MLKKLVVFSFLFIISAFFVHADVEFNGTALDVNGNPLNNSDINLTIRSMQGWSVVGYNSTTTNASGGFNITLHQDGTQAQLWVYELSITHKNSTTNHVDYKSKSIPAFPGMMMVNLAGTSFYLSPAGTINITAVNSTGGRTAFRYQVKDQSLGYPIAQNFDSTVNESIIYVPSDRNYSIMIYPDRSMPVSFNWNNFSSTSSYNITANAKSSYNATTYTLIKEFNTTMSLPRVSGYLNYSGINGFDEFIVIPYLLEPGNMVHSEYGDMPFNLSAIENDGATNNQTDFFNASNGFYNISLPATVETSTVLFFATARNGSTYYGSFRNISLAYGTYATTDEEDNFNFSYTSGLLGVNSTVINGVNVTNITMEKIGQGGPMTYEYVSTKKQIFYLINGTNSTIGNTSAHVEVTVDYSSYGAVEFTWMGDVAQSSTISNFALPLLNSTGIKEMNVFASGGGGGNSQYAPKTASFTINDLAPHLSGTNITIKTFNPGGIGSSIAAGSISIALYLSNSSCDVPNPVSNCLKGSSQTMTEFNPMQAVMGGGKISFRMGIGGILVHYINVDLMASGPPDAVFDNQANTNGTSSSSFASALRFGSSGPKIYDYALISMPYSETAGSGLNENAAVNLSIPVFYDDNWNVIWNTTSNGTNMGAFAANYSHYNARQSEWAYLLNQSICVTNVSRFNITNPCYIDTTNNKIWVRVPHFSGTGPSVIGSTVATTAAVVTPGAASTPKTDGSLPAVEEGASTGTRIDFSTLTTIPMSVTEGQVFVLDFSGSYSEGNLGFHSITIEKIMSDYITLTIRSDPIIVTLKINEEKKVDINNDGVDDLSILLKSIENGKADLVYTKLAGANKIAEEEIEISNITNETRESSKTLWIWIGIIVLVILILIGVWYKVRVR